MRFRLPTDFRPLKYPMMVVDFFKAFLSGFLLLLVVMSLAAAVAYRAEYMGGEKQGVTITVDEELLHRIDDFQVENGLDNRTEAIRSLLNRALTEIDKPISESSSFEEEAISESGSTEEEPTLETSLSEEKPVSETSPSEEGPAPESVPSEEEPTLETSLSEEKPVSETSPSEEEPASDRSPSDKATQSDKATSENGPSEEVTEPQ